MQPSEAGVPSRPTGLPQCSRARNILHHMFWESLARGSCSLGLEDRDEAANHAQHGESRDVSYRSSHGALSLHATVRFYF